MIRLGFDLVRLRRRLHWSPQKIARLQERRWRRLLKYACSHSAYYRERFRGIDLTRCRPTDLPTLTKAEMMAHFDEIVTDRRISRADVERFISDPANLTRHYLGKYAVCHTSGSQGQPAIVVQARRKLFLGIEAQLARGGDLHSLAGWYLKRIHQPVRFAVITQKPGFYPTGALFSHLSQMHVRILEFLHLSVFDRVEELVERLNEFQPEFIASYASSLATLAREEIEGRLRLCPKAELRHLINMSEPLPEEMRVLVERAFGIHVANLYSMAECMALTVGCDREGGSHLNSDLAMLEVVDADDRPVPEGTQGAKVLMTNLYNRIQPLIRYEIGDRVTISPSACPCGSPFPLIAPVMSRSDDRFWIEQNGSYREIPYFLFLAALHHCTDMAEHQVLQTARNQFVVRVAPQPGKILSRERLDRYIGESVAAEGLDGILKWTVDIVPEIGPNAHTGKMHRVVSLVGAPSATNGGRAKQNEKVARLE
jgi:phenylacetate-CoA ligase